MRRISCLKYWKTLSWKDPLILVVLKGWILNPILILIRLLKRKERLWSITANYNLSLMPNTSHQTSFLPYNTWSMFSQKCTDLVSGFHLKMQTSLQGVDFSKEKKWNRVKPMSKIQWLQFTTAGEWGLLIGVLTSDTLQDSRGHHTRAQNTTWSLGLSFFVRKLEVHLPQCWHMLTELDEVIFVMGTELLCNNQIPRCCNYISTERSGQWSCRLSDHIQMKIGTTNYVECWLMEWTCQLLRKSHNY